MAKWLKQSTAASIIAGPFIAETDGYTSTESHTTMNVLLFKNSASDTVTSQAVTHTASGYYNVELDSGSTDTLGRLRLGFNNSASYLPVWEEYMVMPANTYDSLVAGTDRLAASLGASGIAASTFGACAIDSDTIAATGADKVGDHTLRREWGDAASSVDGDSLDFRSLLGAVAKLVNRIAESGGTLTVYEADDTTSLGTQTVTTSATAEPITELDTD